LDRKVRSTKRSGGFIIKQIKVLLVEDSVYSADLNVRELKRAGFAVDSRIVTGSGALEEALLSGQWDVILSDNNMPGFDALRAIEIRNGLAPGVSFIIVSEDIDQKDVIRAMEQGCYAYLAKKDLNLLGKLVKNMLE